MEQRDNARRGRRDREGKLLSSLEGTRRDRKVDWYNEIWGEGEGKRNALRNRTCSCAGGKRLASRDLYPM